MKKIGSISAMLLLIIALAMLLPSSAIAAPTMEDEGKLRAFNGSWVATRTAHGREIAQWLWIWCSRHRDVCAVLLVAEWSNSCSEAHGEETGAMLRGWGPVSLEWPRMTINVDAYCLTMPPMYSDFSPDIWFEHNEDDRTLEDNIGTLWHRRWHVEDDD